MIALSCLHFIFRQKAATRIAQAKKISRTGVYGVAIKEGKILLIIQKSGPHQGKYDLPGGRIEFGETIEQALQREFQEEVSMSFDSMVLLDNWVEKVDVPQKGQKEPYVFHRIGLIYVITGLHDSNEKSADSMSFIWKEMHEIQEKETASLAWSVIQKLKDSPPPSPQLDTKSCI